MPVVGRKPVEDRSQVLNRNKPAEGTEWLDVENVPHDGPPLPDRDDASSTAYERPIGVQAAGWPQATLRWWEAVRTMPHAATWTDTDWQIAYAAAEAHARFCEGWKGCSSGSELRQREKLLGMSRDARRDLRIRYVEPKRKPAAGDVPDNVTQLDDFRSL
jgi:hypothetical protein